MRPNLRSASQIVLGLAMSAALLPLLLKVYSTSLSEELLPIVFSLGLTAIPYGVAYAVFLKPGFADSNRSRHVAVFGLACIMLVLNILLYLIPLSQPQSSTTALAYFLLPVVYVVSAPAVVWALQLGIPYGALTTPRSS